MTLPAAGGRGAVLDEEPGAVDDFNMGPGNGVEVFEGTAEEGRDQPAPLGCGVAVSFAVTRRGWGVVVCDTGFSRRMKSLR